MKPSATNCFSHYGPVDDPASKVTNCIENIACASVQYKRSKDLPKYGTDCLERHHLCKRIAPEAGTRDYENRIGVDGKQGSTTEIAEVEAGKILWKSPLEAMDESIYEVDREHRNPKEQIDFFGGRLFSLIQ